MKFVLQSYLNWLKIISLLWRPVRLSKAYFLFLVILLPKIEIAWKKTAKKIILLKSWKVPEISIDESESESDYDSDESDVIIFDDE